MTERDQNIPRGPIDWDWYATEDMVFSVLGITDNGKCVWSGCDRDHEIVGGRAEQASFN